MNPSVKRAGAFAAVGSLSLSAVWLEAAAFVPFAMVAIFGLVVVTEGPLFDLFARPGDYERRRLYGLTGFALAATALGLFVMFGLPIEIFISTICLLVYGNLFEQIVGTRYDRQRINIFGFVIGGSLAGVLGYLTTRIFTASAIGEIPIAVFLVATGTLIAAILRTMLFRRDDPLVLLSVGIVLWFFAEIGIETTPSEISIALLVTVALGYVSYILDTASITGMLTGILLGLLTIVLGGFEWFIVLIAFFAIGGLATKYQFEEKSRRGVAEANQGARGTGNVLSNSAIALLAVIGFAASHEHTSIVPDLFLFAFAGAIATALSDTLSSEIGGVYDDPRLITTFEPVDPGTNGGVTWQGSMAGIVGSVIIAVIALIFFNEIGIIGSVIICGAGALGMMADSVFGATIENRWLNNQVVNFLATVVGAGTGVGFAWSVGLL